MTSLEWHCSVLFLWKFSVCWCRMTVIFFLIFTWTWNFHMLHSVDRTKINIYPLEKNLSLLIGTLCITELLSRREGLWRQKNSCQSDSLLKRIIRLSGVYKYTQIPWNYLFSYLYSKHDKMLLLKESLYFFLHIPV